MPPQPDSGAARPATPAATAADVPATVLDDSARLGWHSVHVQRWHDDPVVARLEAPVLDSHGIVFVTGGTTLIEEKTATGWRRAHFRPGSIGLNDAGSTRTLRWRALTAEAIESVHIFLSADLVDETAEAFGHRSRFPNAFDLQRPEIVPHVRALEWGLRREAPALFGDAAACTLLGRLLAPSPSRVAGAMGPRTLERVIDRMRSGLSEDLRLDELCGVAHLSRYHLVRSFRAATGVPPHAYLRRLRMQRAAELLTATELSVAAIAGACGYRSTSSFGAAFRTELGASPSRYRASARP